MTKASVATTIVFVCGCKWQSNNLLRTYRAWIKHLQKDYQLSHERKIQLQKAEIYIPALLEYQKSKGWNE